MPDSATAVDYSTMTASELASCEPKVDRRTKEWRDWKDSHEAAIKREMTVVPPSLEPAPAPPADTVTLATPPAPVEPVRSSLPPAAPVADSRRVVMNPVEFATQILTRNPRDIMAYAGQRNSSAAVAGDVERLYGAYLLLVSPAYLAHAKAENAAKHPAERSVFPDVGVLEEMYRIATAS